MRKPSTARSTIKNDPFAAVIPVPASLDLPEANETPVAAAGTKGNGKGSTPPRAARADTADRPVEPTDESKAGKQKLTVHLAFELANRVKNAAYWNPRLTIAGIAEQGIRHAIERIERENGGKYPPREGELIGGRPIK